MIVITPSSSPRYIARFLDGLTTLDEERALYRLYSSGQPLPPEAEELRPMFELLGSIDSPVVTQHHKESWLVNALRWTSIAALFAIVFTAALILPTAHTRAAVPAEDLARYEGSYIVRNGDTIRDLRIVIPEIERLEAEMTRAAARSEGNLYPVTFSTDFNL